MHGWVTERQPHIRSVRKCNDGNLACADYLPMIVWPARLSHKLDLFCSIDRFQFLFPVSSVHEWKCTLLAPPLPLMSVNNSQLCYTTRHNHGCVQQCSTNGKLCILVKAQHRTRSTWRLSPTSLGIRLQDLGLPMQQIHSRPLGPFCCFYRHKLASTSRQYSLLTAMSHDSTLY